MEVCNWIPSGPIWLYIKHNKHGQNHIWQSQIEIEYYIFWAHHRVWHTIVLSFRWGRGSCGSLTDQLFMHLHVVYKLRPQQKLSVIACQTQWCAQNTRRNNLFGMATYVKREDWEGEERNSGSFTLDICSYDSASPHNGIAQLGWQTHRHAIELFVSRKAHPHRQ